MDTGGNLEFKKMFDALSPDEQLDWLLALFGEQAETPESKRERHMLYLQMMGLDGVNADEALGCQTIKPDAFKTLHFKKPEFEWPRITLALPIDPKSPYLFKYRQRDELRDAILAFKASDLDEEDDA
jgi:hypothetical protein